MVRRSIELALAAVVVAASVGGIAVMRQPAPDSRVAAGPLVSGEAVVYKSATCGCCSEYVDYMKDAGYTVEAIDTEEMSGVKARAGVPGSMQSCHTTQIGRYFVEGHVPLEAVEKLLAEQPDIDGIALPGMDEGTPGMPGERTEPLTIYAISDGEAVEFMTIP